MLCSPGLVAAEADGDVVTAPRRVRISMDPHLSVETGVDLTLGALAMLSLGEGRLLPTERLSPAAGVAARAARIVLLDLPLSFWFTILQHEVFGHGGRAREFGVSAGAHLASPWDFRRTAFATFDETGLTPGERLRLYAGGAESNSRGATVLARQMAAGEPLAAAELLYLAWSRYATSAYVLRTTPDPERDPTGFFGEWAGGGDVAHYLGHLNETFTGVPGITPAGVDAAVLTQWRRLERQAWWNLVDPGLWLALWRTGRLMAVDGAPGAVPLPEVGGWRLLPVLGADWTPEGGAASLEVVLGAPPGRSRRPAWFSFTGRRGRGPGGTFGALGAAAGDLVRSRRLSWGGEMEVWTRPDGGLGGGVKVRTSVRAGRGRGFFWELGVKSAGHWPGRPAATGPFGRLGYAYAF